MTDSSAATKARRYRHSVLALEAAVEKEGTVGTTGQELKQVRKAVDATVLVLIERGIEIGYEELEPMPGEPRRTHHEDVALWHRVAESLLKGEELEKP